MARRTSTVGSPASDNESVSVSSRKIDNGYIVTRSRYDGETYSSSETFSAERPKLEVERLSSAESNAGSESMRRAIGALNRR